MTLPITTDRLVIRDWTADDAEAAYQIYGSSDVTHWLTPAMDRVADAAAMRSVLQAWQEAQPNLTPPRGRWAVELRSDGRVIGGLGIRLLPPYREDLELSWQLRPEEWGHGYATEAARALVEWAFSQDGTDELFAVARPSNSRAGVACQGGKDALTSHPRPQESFVSGCGGGVGAPIVGCTGAV